jgi:hypothetical protein
MEAQDSISALSLGRVAMEESRVTIPLPEPERAGSLTPHIFFLCEYVTEFVPKEDHLVVIATLNGKKLGLLEL